MAQIDFQIGHKIKTKRRKLSITQADLARKISISASYLNLIESGKRKVNVDLLLKLTNELNIEISDISKKTDTNLYQNLMDLLGDNLFEDLDITNFDIKELLGAIQEYSPGPLVIRQIPIREEDKIIGAADVIHERAYVYEKDKPSQIVKVPEQLSSTRVEIREKLLETLADFDDALMEKIIEDVPTSTEEVYENLKKDIASNKIVEVLTGSAENETGIRRLLKSIRHDCPSHEKTIERNGLKITSNASCVQVFKTNFVPHRGKQSFVRV